MPGLQLIGEDFGQSKRVNTLFFRRCCGDGQVLLCERQDLLQLETLFASGATGFAQGHGPGVGLERSGCSLGSSP